MKQNELKEDAVPIKKGITVKISPAADIKKLNFTSSYKKHLLQLADKTVKIKRAFRDPVDRGFGPVNQFEVDGYDGDFDSIIIKSIVKENKKGENKMKIKMSELKGMIAEVLKEEESGYQKFFKETLADFGAKSPADLDDAKKKEFFDYIEKNWKGKNETLEPVSAAAGNPLKRVKAKKRDQMLATESKAEAFVRKLVKEELKFVMFNEIPGGLSRKRAKKRINMKGDAKTDQFI